MATSLPFCLLCGVDLPDSKKRRSVLLDAGANVKKVIEDLLRKKLCNDSSLGEQADRLILVYFDRSSVLCKDGCHVFNNVVKLLNQAQAFRDLNNKLEVDFQKSLDAFLLDYSDSVRIQL